MTVDTLPVHHSATVGMQQRPRSAFGIRGIIALKRATCAIIGLLLLAGCSADVKLPEQPSMYADMSKPGATLDTVAAAIMISQYRQNNGLGTVVVDPELTRLAEQQSQAMAARNKMDHNVKGPLDKRLGRRRKHLGRLPHPGGSLLRLAGLAATQGQYAQKRCHKIGHRGDLCSKYQIQGVLDAYPCINLKQVRLRASTLHKTVNSA
jgi:hypothetical protein